MPIVPARLWFLLTLVVVMVGAGSGCVPPQTDDSTTEKASGPSGGALRLAAQDAKIRTVQLYRGSDERALPVVPLQSPEALTLEFDLLKEEGRPLSVYFIHADRQWRRDLSPNQVLSSYQNDRIFDYQSSRGTAVPYVHYEYRFPNDDIRFRVSGNFIVRVTKRGQRDSVLFEQPFFVTDEAGQLEVGAEGIAVSGQRQQSVRPKVRFSPPAALRGDPFGYAVCFVQNGHLPDARCRDEPTLARQPQLSFELEQERAFAPITANYTLDLSNLRSTNTIERLDATRTPVRALLAPDYAELAAPTRGSPLNGRIVVQDAVDGRASPDVSAEYVETTFAFVPPSDRRLSGNVVVAGSFSGMDPSRGTTMTWRPGAGRYEGTVLLKQGRYGYFYSGTDPTLRETIRRTQPLRRSTYTTFVYYRDPSLGTDRLLRVGRVEAR
ncbi:MAG: DUF5103 domain-containing protein [Bacteroidetes bacterium SW_9_63_38]|nr:MAG: DUF5103 domain-containing protein [Bacteroidetes bacterium SW_9_63_38]